MSLDRRIVSILYFNGIENVEIIQKFLGENNGYYEVLINNEIKKLKIPGFEEINDETIFTSFEYQDEIKKDEIKVKEVFEKELLEEIKKDEIKVKEVFEQKIFEEELLEEKKQPILEISQSISEPFYEIKEVSFEKELEKNEIENEKFLKDVMKEEEKETPKKITKPRLSNKKLKIESKNDDDISDFINLA